VVAVSVVMPDRLAIDRRIGQRHQVFPTEVSWRTVGARGRHHDLTGRGKKAHVVEVSVSGLGVVAPRSRRLAVGSVVSVTYAHGEGVAVVRRMGPVDEDGNVFYGLELVDQSSALAMVLYDTFLARFSRVPAHARWSGAMRLPRRIVLP
jgi:hypothetical protein